MFVNSKSIAKLIEEHFPKYLAESWDMVGFQLGNGNSEVNKVMVTLEITPEVVEEAIDRNIDLIVTHHPLIFSPMKTITEDDPIGSMVRKLILHKINVYAAHTNLDAGNGGTADHLCRILGVKGTEPLFYEKSIAYQKLTYFVPETHIEVVRKAMSAAGAGVLGNYSHCTFSGSGIGTFMPMEDSNPYAGQKGVVEYANELRIEAVVPAHLSQLVIDAVNKVHPYELPAYDLVKLENTLVPYSYAKKGHLDEPMTLEALAKKTSEILGANGVKIVGSPTDTIRTVAVCPGAGADYMKQAVQAGCDVLITGDVKYHQAQYAKQIKLKIIDAGHYETERIYIDAFKSKLEVLFDKKGYETKIVVSDALSNPFWYL